MSDRIVGRISRGAGDGLLDTLAHGMQPTDLQSLMLAVYRARAGRVSPADLLRQWRGNRFVRPSVVSPVEMHRFDLAAYEMLHGRYEPIELSPLSPLGCASALGPVDQNNVVSTARNTEVAPDATNAMALECALRRGELLAADAHSMEWVRLCASQRLMRAQGTKDPHSFAHFQIFALCAAGHDEGSMRFERRAVVEHARFYLDLFRALEPLGYVFAGNELELMLYSPDARELAQECADALAGEGVAIRFTEKYDQSYYRCLGFHLYSTSPAGEKLFLADGGITDWTQKLLANRKERLMISGIGTERLISCFRVEQNNL